MPSRFPTAAVLLLAIVSGAAALAYEVVFFRALGLVFGVASHSVAAVVGSFLFGLGLGAWLGGRLLASFAPLRAYAAVEAAIAIFGYASPFLFRWLRGLAEQGSFGSGPLYPIVAFAGSFVLLAWPTLLMGATFPLLGRAIANAGGGRSLATRIGWLYALNTLGAAGGALLAAYALLPELGMVGATHVAAGLNVALAIAALFLAANPAVDDAPRDAAAAASEPPVAESQIPYVELAAAVAAIGFAAIALQVLANRLLVSLLGGTVYVFAAIVAVFLIGIAAGGAAGGHLAARSRRPISLLALLALAFAGAVGVGLLAIAERAGGEDLLQGPDNIGLLAPGERATAFPPLRYLGLAFSWSFLALFAATALSGAFLPAAIRIALRARQDLGRTLGGLYFWNTAGSIAGSVVASFLLLPHLGLRGGYLVVTLCGLLAGGLLLRRAALAREPRGAGFTVPLAAVALLLVVPGGFALRRGDPPGTRYALRTVFHAEAAASAAKVQEVDDAAERDPVRLLRVNGKTVASSIFIDRRLQYLLGFVSTLVHPEPREMVCIGLGTGMTSAAMAAAGGDLTVVEISPAVIRAAREFASWNLELHDRDDVTIVADDGRAWLARTTRRFDVISADPIDPCVSGSAYLYTEEYYQLGKSRLAPGGVMSQWIPLYDLALEDIAGIALTFRAVFPDATAWVTGYDMVLLGANGELVLDPGRLATRVAQEPVAAMLRDVGVGSANDLLATCFAGRVGLEALIAHAHGKNTDEHPWIEFHAPRAAFGSYPLAVYRLLGKAEDEPPLLSGLAAGARSAVTAARDDLQRGALRFVEDIEGGYGYGGARNRYIEFLRGTAAAPELPQEPEQSR
jgi:spermidine synthase